MKFTFCLCIIGFLSFSIKAQILLNATDHPVSGEVWIGVGSEQDTLATPTLGANQTWNYASVPLFTETSELVFGSGAGQGNIYPFGQVDLVGRLGSFGDSVFVGFETKTNGLFIKGQSSSNPGNGFSFDTHTPSECLIPFGLAINQTYTQNGLSVSEFQGAGAEGTRSQIKSRYSKRITLVGFGSLTTPVLQTSPALLFRERYISEDSIFQEQTPGAGLEFSSFRVDTSYSYIFTKKGPGMVAAFFNLDSASGVCTSGEFYSPSQVVSLKSNLGEALGVFPNPSSFSQALYLQVPEDSKVSVVDMAGRQVQALDVKAETSTVIRWENPIPGIYMLEAKSASGKVLLRQKLVRQ
jgi:hypothetical protein